MSLSSWITWLYSFLFFTLPLLYFTPIQNPYEFPKFIFFVITTQIIFVLTVYTYFKKKKMFITSLDKLTIGILLFGGVVFITDIFGIDPRISLLGSMYRHQGFILLLSCIILYLTLRRVDKKMLLSIFDATIISTVVVCIIALLFGPMYQGRIIGTLGNPNFLGGYLAIIVAILLFSTYKLVFKIPLLTLIIITIFLSNSRGAMLATGCVITIYSIKIILQQKNKLLLFIGTGILMLLFSQFSPSKLLLTRNSIWENRSLIWQEGLQAVQKRPILGYGQENFELIFNPDLKMKVDNAHNIFLEIAVSSGLVGLTIFLFIIALTFYKANPMIRVGLIAFLITAQFNPLSISQIALLWLLVGSVRNKNSKNLKGD